MPERTVIQACRKYRRPIASKTVCRKVTVIRVVSVKVTTWMASWGVSAER